MTAAVEIRETIVTPTKDGVSVQLHISDVPKDAEGATFQLVLLATLPKPQTQIVEGLQMAALEKARKLLVKMHQELYQQIPAQVQSLLHRSQDL